jgi:hypothetical protein
MLHLTYYLTIIGFLKIKKEILFGVNRKYRSWGNQRAGVIVVKAVMKGGSRFKFFV